MARPRSVLTCISALAIAGSLFILPPTFARAGEPTGSPAQLNAAEAMRAAIQSGETVVASALTDEYTLVTADPETGLMTAHLSAAIARVEDGAGGWREPSANLVQGADGRWRPEAAAADVTVSGGGDGQIATLADGSAEVGFDWPTSLPEPTVDGNLATYSEVVPGVDLAVRAALDGVETFIVVKTPEAAQNPLVQSVPIAASAPGLTATTEGNGDVTLSDAAGEDRLMLPKAYAWDSAGQDDDANLHELIEMAEGSEVVPLDAQIESSTAGDAANLSMAADLLNDPDTVFPVVIDPSAHRSKTHALRVTQTFHKYDSDIGSTAKLGYNGWTSPYYKSRMFYQFSWPVNGDGSLVRPAQIASAKFHYKQTYSPQSSCSNTTFGPSVKVQPSGVISGDVDWGDQPGLHSGSVSASNDYAVGQDCGSHTQVWNITSMLVNERTDYATRTTVTFRVSSADETDRNGWREYANSSTSPELEVDYEGEPPAPTGITVDDAFGAGSAVTYQGSPVIRADLNVDEGYASRETTKCLQAEITLLKADSQGNFTVFQAAALNNDAVQPGGRTRVELNNLPGGTYVARMRTYHSVIMLYSKGYTDFSFRVDRSLFTPQWSWNAVPGWTDAFSLPSRQILGISVRPRSSDLKPDAYCVRISEGGDATESCVAAPTDGVLEVGPFASAYGAGTAWVSVAARYGDFVSDYQPDDPEMRSFTASANPSTTNPS